MSKAAWVRVTRAEPCPICEKPDHCGRSADGAVVRCTRIRSDKESKGRDGSTAWIHRLGETQRLDAVVREQPKRPAINWNVEAERHYKHPKAAQMRITMAEQLNVSEASLDALEVGWGCDYEPFATFPMRNPRGDVTGITRRYASGAKKTMKWSRGALFYSLNWFEATAGPVFLPEGASDVAALMTMGLCAIGRFSNLAGAGMLEPLLMTVKRPIVVLCERDEKPDRRGQHDACPANCVGCNHCFPGKYGGLRTAEVLAKRLRGRVHVRFCPDGQKDVRTWLIQHGVNGGLFLSRIWRKENEVR